MGKLDNILRQVIAGGEFLDPKELLKPSGRENKLSTIEGLSCSEELKSQLKAEIYPVVNLRKISKALSRREATEIKNAKTREAIEAVIDASDKDDETKTELKALISDDVQLSNRAKGMLGQNFILLDRTTKDQIKDQELYRLLPNSGEDDSPRARLEREVTGEEPKTLRGVEFSGDDIEYGLVALKYRSGNDAIVELKEHLPKLRAIFADDVKSFDQFVQNYKAAYPSEENILTKAASSISWADTGKVLSNPKWRGLLADPQARGIVDKLIYKHEEFESKFGTKFPKTVDEFLEKAVETDCPEFLDTLSTFSDEALPRDWPRSKIMEYAKEHYKMYVKSDFASSSDDISIDVGLLRSLEVITNPRRKEPIAGRKVLPDIEVDGSEAVAFNHSHAKGSFSESIALLPEELRAEATKTLEQMIKDNNTSVSQYKLEKLDPNDYRGFILGRYTACCQSIDANSKEAVKYGMTEPDSGFYVLKDKKGKIVAQSWAWIDNSGNNIILDSFERSGPEIDHAFEPFYNILTQKLKAQGFENVYVGTGGNTGERDFQQANLVVRNIKPPRREGYKYKKDSDLIYNDSVASFDMSQPTPNNIIKYLIKQNKVTLLKNIWSSMSHVARPPTGLYSKLFGGEYFITERDVGDLLGLSIKSKDIEFTDAILSSGRKINSKTLGKYLVDSVRLKNNVITQKILSSELDMDYKHLCKSLKVATEVRDFKLAEKIFDSIKQSKDISLITGQSNLGEALANAIKNKQPEFAQKLIVYIKKSDQEKSSEVSVMGEILAQALLDAVQTNQFNFAQKILDEDRLNLWGAENLPHVESAMNYLDSGEFISNSDFHIKSAVLENIIIEAAKLDGSDDFISTAMNTHKKISFTNPIDDLPAAKKLFKIANLNGKERYAEQLLLANPDIAKDQELMASISLQKTGDVPKDLLKDLDAESLGKIEKLKQTLQNQPATKTKPRGAVNKLADLICRRR